MLTAQKVKVTEGVYKGFIKTEIRNEGKLVATFGANLRQPRKNGKITLNGHKIDVIWL